VRVCVRVFTVAAAESNDSVILL